MTNTYSNTPWYYYIFIYIILCCMLTRIDIHIELMNRQA